MPRTFPPRTWLFAATLLLLISPPIEARKKKVRVQPYKTQTTFTFQHREARPAYALHVVLSRHASVVTDPRTGFAGPFRDIRGSGSHHLKLLNLAVPLREGEAVTLAFRSDKKRLRVKKYWWTDRSGRRIGTAVRLSQNM